MKHNKLSQQATQHNTYGMAINAYERVQLAALRQMSATVSAFDDATARQE
jgi:hypothetical protein